MNGQEQASQNNQNQKGQMEIICGCMFSGKSTELIRRLTSIENQVAVRTFKPKIDHRYSINAVVSHNGLSIQAQPINHAQEIFQFIDINTKVIGIDEVQFFDEEIVEVVDKLKDRGIRIILSGLITDFRGEPFGTLPVLMTKEGIHVTMLHAACTICEEKATRNQRLINGQPASYDEPVIVLGAAESYEPRCEQHHEILNKPLIQV